MLLADDVLGELDPARRHRFWATLDPESQVIATGTELPTREGRPDAELGNWQVFAIEDGAVTMLPARGPVDDTVQGILGGLRSACTYVGARKLKDLSKCTTFVRVTQQINDVFGPAS